MRSPLILISPYAAVAFSVAAAAVAILFPPRLYREMMREPNYIFLDARSIGFIVLCVVAFSIGYAMFHLARRRPIVYDPGEAQTAPGARIGTDLVLGGLLLLANVAVLLMFVRVISLDALLAAMIGLTRSAPMRQALSDLLGQSNLGSMMVVTRLFLPYLAWRYLAQRSAGGGGARSLAMLLAPLLAAHMAIMILIGTRAGLLLVVFGLLLVGALHLWAHGRLRWKTVIPIGTAAAIFALTFFGVVAHTRRGIPPSEWELSTVVQDVAGYYVGSYNRLAAITGGVLEMPGARKGYYWTGWVWNVPVLENVLDLHGVADYVYQNPPETGWFAVSPRVDAVGLNRRYTAITIFSFSFIDFGWAGFLPFIPYGFLVAYCWHSFTRGRLIGLIAYPVVLWSVLEWRGHIWITRPANIYIIITILLVWAGHVAERSLKGTHDSWRGRVLSGADGQKRSGTS